MFQDDPESYNGARREHYRWAQSITDVDLRVNVRQTKPRGYKTFFMFNSTEYEIFPAHKC